MTENTTTDKLPLWHAVVGMIDNLEDCGLDDEEQSELAVAYWQAFWTAYTGGDVGPDEVGTLCHACGQVWADEIEPAVFTILKAVGRTGEPVIWLACEDCLNTLGLHGIGLGLLSGLGIAPDDFIVHGETLH